MAYKFDSIVNKSEADALKDMILDVFKSDQKA